MIAKLLTKIYCSRKGNAISWSAGDMACKYQP
jgi:hypothetical protein